MRLLATLALLALALPVLAACGFRPVYGPSGAETAELSEVFVAAIPERSGQILRNALTDRLNAKGRAAKPKYRLEVSLSESRTDFGIRKDATSTRGQLSEYASWRLLDATSGTQLFAASARAINSYDILVSEYGTLVTEQEARDRGLAELAESIAQRLALELGK